jgi:hypothetical protein
MIVCALAPSDTVATGGGALREEAKIGGNSPAKKRRARDRGAVVGRAPIMGSNSPCQN